MAQLISKKALASGKAMCLIEANSKEMLELKGSLHNVYAFSAKSCKINAKIIGMGLNHSVKYFEVPENMVFKNDTKNPVKEKLRISCQIIKDDSKTFCIYIVHKSPELS
jgi:hypothetical protein